MKKLIFGSLLTICAFETASFANCPASIPYADIAATPELNNLALGGKQIIYGIITIGTVNYPIPLAKFRELSSREEISEEVGILSQTLGASLNTNGILSIPKTTETSALCTYTRAWFENWHHVEVTIKLKNK